MNVGRVTGGSEKSSTIENYEFGKNYINLRDEGNVLWI